MVIASAMSTIRCARSKRRPRDLVLGTRHRSPRARSGSGLARPRGTLTIDAGAAAALRHGKSLLPAGVIRVDGSFGRGDAVVIRGPDGAEIGRGSRRL